jgi:diadenosine tetraphosphate (Ap4A) HIT family hydrolase
MLVIPLRHVQTCFDMTKEEKNSLFELPDACKKLIDKTYAPDGYNVGMNVNYVAGRNVMHGRDLPPGPGVILHRHARHP